MPADTDAIHVKRSKRVSEMLDIAALEESAKLNLRNSLLLFYTIA